MLKSYHTEPVAYTSNTKTKIKYNQQLIYRPTESCFRRRKQFNSSVKPAIGNHTKSNKTGRPGISLCKQIGGLNKSKIRKMSKYKQTNQQSSTDDFSSVAQ